MDVQETGLEGLKLLKPKKFGDNRGFFSEVYSVRAMADAGIADVFVQDNHSFSAERGVVRGLHYQLPPHSQVKLLRVTRGAIFDVAVDIRGGSPTYGRHFSTELSADNWCQLYVPAGFAHGFATLTTDCEVLYKVDRFYAPASDFGVLWNDPDIGIAWPITAAEAILSARDAKHPGLRDLKSPFQYGAQS
jgi:dTDP-4-dehydrorhamnose 3,5-epimerase